MIGAFFLPALALALLTLNGRTRIIGREHKNRPFTSLILVVCIVFFFALAGGMEVWRKLTG